MMSENAISHVHSDDRTLLIHSNLRGRKLVKAAYK